MQLNTREVNDILAKLGGSLPAELVSGRLCGLVCEVCPLRVWKSPGITPVTCETLLTVARQHRPWTAGIQSTILKLKLLFGSRAFFPPPYAKRTH
jgi:hypothetical protein